MKIPVNNRNKAKKSNAIVSPKCIVIIIRAIINNTITPAMINTIPNLLIISPFF